MIILLSLLIISLLVMITMIYLKHRQSTSGRYPLPFFNDKSDQWVENTYASFRRFFRHWNWRTVQLLYHFFLEKFENLFLQAFRYLRKKISPHVDMVRGQGNIKEDKNSSSFFLKNIEEHKNNLNNK